MGTLFTLFSVCCRLILCFRTAESTAQVWDMALLELQGRGVLELLSRVRSDYLSPVQELNPPSQEEVMPTEVATDVAKNEKVIEAMPGVLVKGEDGSLKKIVTPGVDMPMPDFKPEPTR